MKFSGGLNALAKMCKPIIKQINLCNHMGYLNCCGGVRVGLDITMKITLNES